MIDAIFIQSWHKELINKSLRCLLHQVHDNIENPVPVWAFVDSTSLDIPDALKEMKQLQQQGLIRFEFVDDTEYKNPQTTVFYHMLRSKSHMYPRILLLESDCRLLSNFDTHINQDIQSLDNWWIYGSTYYGIGGGEPEQDTNHIRRNHMNGVGVYNRARSDLLSFAEQVYIKQRGVDATEAFDWLFAIRYFDSEYADKKLLFDSPYIINLSPVWDSDVHYATRKPHAKIIHQKITS